MSLFATYLFAISASKSPDRTHPCQTVSVDTRPVQVRPGFASGLDHPAGLIGSRVGPESRHGPLSDCLSLEVRGASRVLGCATW